MRLSVKILVMLTLAILLILAVGMLGSKYWVYRSNSQAARVGQLQIKDAYILSRIAEDRLQYANDIRTAQELLKLAQDQLLNADLPAQDARKLQDSFTASQQRLQSINTPDLFAVYNQVLPLENMVATLNSKGAVFEPLDQNATPVVAAIENQPQESSWRQQAKDIFNKLKKLVKIKKKTDIPTSIAQLNTQISRAQLKLLLEQIKWSLLYRDPQVYILSVRSAQNLLNQDFDTNTQVGQEFMRVLNSLQTVQIQPDRASVQDLVNELQQFLIG